MLNTWRDARVTMQQQDALHMQEQAKTQIMHMAP